MRAVRICTASGCDRSADRRADGQSVCSMHFFRWKRLGDVNAPVKERAAPGVKHPCSVDGCELDKRTNGYCDKHYQRVRRLGGIEVASEWAATTTKTHTASGIGGINVSKRIATTTEATNPTREGRFFSAQEEPNE